MSNVVSFHPERRSTWAAKHLEYFRTSHAWLAEHLAGLSDEQLSVEREELERLINSRRLGEGADLGGLAASCGYNAEARRRGRPWPFPDSDPEDAA